MDLLTGRGESDSHHSETKQVKTSMQLGLRERYPVKLNYFISSTLPQKILVGFGLHLDYIYYYKICLKLVPKASNFVAKSEPSELQCITGLVQKQIKLERTKYRRNTPSNFS